jgi:hypothetical protein
MSFLDIGSSFTSEQRRLRLEKWGFNCTCQLCTAPEESRIAHDQHLTSLLDHKNSLRDALRKRDANAAIDLLKRNIELLAEAESASLRIEPYGSLSRIYWAMGDKDNAEMYAHMALDLAEKYEFLEVRNRTKDIRNVLEMFSI